MDLRPSPRFKPSRPSCPLRELRERSARRGCVRLLQHWLARLTSARTEPGSQARVKPEMGSLLGNVCLQGSYLLHTAGCEQCV